jgi:hypothetical protein
MDEPRFESDKLTESYTLRIPAITKRMIDKLTKSQVKQLNERIMITMASVLHQARFDPAFYLVDEYDDRSHSSR